MIELILGMAASLIILGYLFPFVTIYGESMYPTYRERETIVTTRLFRKSKLKADDIVLYHPPHDRRKIVIKRIEMINHTSKVMYCLGDNREDSYDSRHYGSIPFSSVVCKPVRWRHRRYKEDE